MRVGFHIVRFDWPDSPASIAPTLVQVGRSAEAVGATVLTLMDHWFQMDSFAPATDPMLEGYTALGYLAAHTETVQLGLLVTGVTYRRPGLLAKIVATLDVLSEGRGQLGIGAAWYEREHLGLGVPFPPVAERFELLEETLQICQQMWSDDDGPYSGRHFRLAETICSPRPISAPRPKILIGGSGERKTLRLVARYADACNLFAASVEDVAHKLEVLDRHCENEERDPATIDRTMLAIADPFTDLDGFLADMDRYAALGINQVELMPSGDPVAYIERAGEALIPALRDMGGTT